jgi:hypothetical protein
MKKIIVFLLFLICGIFIACRDKCKSCQANEVCDDGQCVCDNAYRVGTTCIPKGDDVYYYNGGGKYECIPDTFTFSIIDEQPQNPNTVSVAYAYPKLSSIESVSNDDVKYFKKSTGDSLYIGSLFGAFDYCKVNGKDGLGEVSSKFNQSKTELKMDIRFYSTADYKITLDKYSIVLKK